ncbi:MAG: hypothetical protein KGL39_50770 [Patescibacteria group bacterium]|nr:hypothetical protein [Patescibacteria group bacterium]
MSLSQGQYSSNISHFANSLQSNAVTTNTSGSSFTLWIVGNFGSTTAWTVSDTFGNTYTLENQQTYNSGNGTIWQYDCQNGAGGANHQITATLTAGGHGTFGIMTQEVAASTGSSTIDVSNSGTATNFVGGSGNTLNGSAVTTTSTGDLLISVVGGTTTATGTDTITDATGWNNMLISLEDSSSSLICGLSVTTESSTGTYNDIYATAGTGGTHQLALMTVAYKGSGGGGSNTNLTPGAGGLAAGGNSPTDISGTVLVPHTARPREICGVERRLLVPSRKIFLPVRRPLQLRP